jgi:hypothetical protein
MPVEVCPLAEKGKITASKKDRRRMNCLVLLIWTLRKWSREK